MVIKAQHAALMQKTVEPVLLLISYKLPGGLVCLKQMHYQKQKIKKKRKKQTKETVAFRRSTASSGVKNSIPHGNIHDEKISVKQNVWKA